MFDINVPGKIQFKESETLSPGNSFSMFDTREYKTSPLFRELYYSNTAVTLQSLWSSLPPPPSQQWIFRLSDWAFENHCKYNLSLLQVFGSLLKLLKRRCGCKRTKEWKGLKHVTPLA